MSEPGTISVHRCRFVDFVPSPITALCFPPLPLPSVKGKGSFSRGAVLQIGTLAIGRANGNIELCEWTGPANETHASQAWVVRKTLSGPVPSKVDSIALTIRYPDNQAYNEVPVYQNLRLFSSGGGSELIEWDLDRRCVKRTISSQGGSIWSIAANPASTFLALGCEDGSVRLLSLVHDTLSHHRRFDRVQCRILSIAWGPPVPRSIVAGPETQSPEDSSDDDDDDDWSDSWLVTGGSDSSIRKWDVNSGRVVDRMGTDKVRGEKTLVWTVGVLGDGTIISGDSLGMVKFWDSRTCTQLQTFNGHAADVLCLTISPEGTAVYSSGVDQKIAQYTLVSTALPNGKSNPILSSPNHWIQTASRRLHSHDVRALAIWPPHTPLPSSHRRHFPMNIAPVLASGGLDMSVVVTPAALASNTMTKIVNPISTSILATFEDSYHRRLAYSSAPSYMSALKVARQARLLLCMKSTTLSIWRIRSIQAASSTLDEFVAVEPSAIGGWDKILEMELNVQTNLTASAISDDGQWLVASDMYEAKLFKLTTEKNGDLKPKRIRTFSAMLQPHLPEPCGASSFCFTPDSAKLVMASTLDTRVIILDLGASEVKTDEPRVLRTFDRRRSRATTSGERVVIKKKVKKSRSANRATAGDSDIEGVDYAEETEKPNGTITRMAVSSDGQWLATTDDLCRTDIFNLDSVQHHCLLPSFVQPVHGLAFDSARPNLLVLGFPTNTLEFFDVEARQFPDWARELRRSPNPRLWDIHDPLIGVTFDPSLTDKASTLPQYVIMWGSTWVCRIRLNVPDNGKKRGRKTPNTQAAQAQEITTEESSRAYKIITSYRPILFVDFVSAGELVIVERPLVDILSTLPPAYFKPKYGTS